MAELAKGCPLARLSGLVLFDHPGAASPQRAVSPDHSAHDLLRPDRSEQPAVIACQRVVALEPQPAVPEPVPHALDHQQLAAIRPVKEYDVPGTGTAALSDQHAVAGVQMWLHRCAADNGNTEGNAHRTSSG